MSSNKSNTGYTLLPDGGFTIENYNHSKPFTSFFPGIAGTHGTPMWCFYVNRGQCISSFGLTDKDGAITEFVPADKAWIHTQTNGFRTFIKKISGKKVSCYEPFVRNAPENEKNVTQTMTIRQGSLELEDTNRALGIRTNVKITTVPSRPYAGIAREVTVTNIGRTPAKLEVIDGLPFVMPFGMHLWLIKHISRTTQAWMTVENMENGVPFYKFKVEMLDKPETRHLSGGNFFVHAAGSPDKVNKKNIITDPDLIFGNGGQWDMPYYFQATTPFKIPAGQNAENKAACAMGFHCLTLKPKTGKTFYTVIGRSDSLEKLNGQIVPDIDKNYFTDIEEENSKLLSEITRPVTTCSNVVLFDHYSSQTFLDNVLRGGMPIEIETPSGPLTYYMYSRKHGDLERDYNNFVVAADYYSTGNGNYRDINQNRRSDVKFFPETKDYNLAIFLQTIQLDGYNPLKIEGTRFVAGKDTAKTIAALKLGKTKQKPLEEFTAKPFIPGSLLRFLKEKLDIAPTKADTAMRAILAQSERRELAEHGEGFWTDHWTYNTDLIENYLQMYPETLEHILLGKKDFTYFDTDHYLAPRAQRYVLDRGKARQYESVVASKEKAALISSRTLAPSAARDKNGTGKIFTSNMLVKLLVLAATKTANLDANGTGIELSSDKPNWYDALNGLPALFGSSTNETFELRRLLRFVLNLLAKPELEQHKSVEIFEELADFIGELTKTLEAQPDSFAFWDRANTAAESYRQKVFMGIDGKLRETDMDDVRKFLSLALNRVEAGLKKAVEKKTGLYHSYFINEVTKYKLTGTKQAATGLDSIKALAFRQIPLPHFLEGQMHAMRTEPKAGALKKLYANVRKSDLFDRKLNMYKVNAALSGAPDEIGRAKIFSAGWLENESVWMHMQYKYLLELLRREMFEEFFTELKNLLVCFQPPERYGRSILENSSFIVSGAYHDKTLVGNGFAARLSGATAEFAQIWQMMMFGAEPFKMKDGELVFELRPALPDWMFTDKTKTVSGVFGRGTHLSLPKGSLLCMFGSKTPVIYNNRHGKNTFGTNGVRVTNYVLHNKKGTKVSIHASCVPAALARKIRQGEFSRIDVTLEF